MIPVGRGQRELVIGDRQTGKSTVCIDTILNQKNFMENLYFVYMLQLDKSVNCSRNRKMLEEKVQWFIPLLLMLLIQLRCKFMPFAGAAIGEYFRDSGRPALIVYDDLSKQAVATVVSLLRTPT
jgi:F-type H+-transporting ATPase subunit alpha